MKDEVLAEFDKAELGGYTFFFNPDHGYCYTAGSRIALFADEYGWAVVFEKNGYANRSFNTSIELNYFGNCLRNLDRAGLGDVFTCNAKYFVLFEEEDICYDSDEEQFYEKLNPEITTVNIHGAAVEVIHDPKTYESNGIELEGSIPSIIEYTYLLAETKPEVLWATEEELRTCLPADLPHIGYIYEWHQDPETPYNRRPSSDETYQLVAKCIEARSLEPFKPSLPPNNHRSNWPNAGNL